VRALLVALALLGCAPLPPVPPTPGDASCGTACARARELGCRHGAPSPGGVTCEQTCDALLEVQPVDLACLTSATSCEARCP
jgi:hypothetical protein